ncbi:MAG: hypothetical protein BWY76_03497 [bacterium ADurb.Bin429]|nr:MAG: hypothetical protein BWY76_03497 [bacterium ADurb.Bin429]
MTEPEPMTWTVHLAAQRPGRAAVAILLIVLALFGVNALAPAQWGEGGRVLMLLLTALLLFASVAEFLLPVTYTLDAGGAQARLPGSTRLLPWARVRRVYLRPDGIKLSPLVASGWMEQYRGVFLRTYDREAVLCAVRAWLADAGVTPEFVEDV